jgi:hypothetical protein
MATKRLGQLRNSISNPPRLRVRPFRKASVRRPANVRRLLPRYVHRCIPTEIHFSFHPPGEARHVPKSVPCAHWIRLRGLPAIFQLRVIGSHHYHPNQSAKNSGHYPWSTIQTRKSRVPEPSQSRERLKESEIPKGNFIQKSFAHA